MAENDNDNRIEHESPVIEELKWGSMKIKGHPVCKDSKLFPGGAEEWDWQKTDTHHVPGIQKADVEFLIEKGAKRIVLSKGMRDKLNISDDTKKFFEEKNMKLNVDYFFETTLKAKDIYNQLANNKEPVGALIHTTC